MEPGLESYLALSGILFSIGAVGVIFKRNAIGMFMCIELMLNAVNITFVAFSTALDDIAGQTAVFFVLVVAAAEVVDIVTEPGFLERVVTVGERLGEAFADLAFGVRRRGMLLAFVFADPHGGMTAMKALFDAGVYAFFASYDPAVLQFKPVLTATDDDIDAIIDIVRRTFPPGPAA